MKTLTATFICVCFAALAAQAHEPITLKPGEVVAFLGGTNSVNMQSAGYFETALTAANPKTQAHFIDMSWEGDTVYRQGTVIERWRKDKYGDLARQLSDNKVTGVIVQFGQSEAIEGLDALGKFTAAYDELLSYCRQGDRHVLVISPTPFERMEDKFLPDLSQRNDDLAKYNEAIGQLAKRHDCKFVDLFSHFATPRSPGPRYHERLKSKLTANGLHIKPDSQRRVANAITRLLGIPHYDDSMAVLRESIVRKHTLWMSYWRPANWKCLYGDDGERKFGKATAGGLTLREEWKQLPELIANSEARIWDTARERE